MYGMEQREGRTGGAAVVLPREAATCSLAPSFHRKLLMGNRESFNLEKKRLGKDSSWENRVVAVVKGNTLQALRSTRRSY